ncbi:hypothetical protein HPB51_017535 [Rhipicephalus microplus]|uniref:Methyltransferase domain-containing protein n=1 Tax=Rhipicephalus microplus TaxID=6941 RepID=A0A9J6EBK2_RHIMP|nr:hypothetical protein HPB51_017535 [Rhipicephalus microplus]
MPTHGTAPSRSATHSLSGTQATADSVYGPVDHYCRPSGENVRLCVTEYAKHNSIQRRYSQFVLDFCRLAFSTEPDPSPQFLDVGCGTGDFTWDILMPQCLPRRRIVGVDCSREMVEYARRSSAHEKLGFEVLDICGDVTGFLEELEMRMQDDDTAGSDGGIECSAFASTFNLVNMALLNSATAGCRKCCARL